MLSVIGGLLVVAGAVFMLLGSIGILRLPDFYSRTHAATNVDTLGVFLFVIGLAVNEGFSQTTIKLTLVAVFVLLVNPVGTHALANSAMVSGLKPWKKPGTNAPEASEATETAETTETPGAAETPAAPEPPNTPPTGEGS
jgi:multicomponent Na+:H+ antiporter subunit G